LTEQPPSVARILVPMDYSDTADRALDWAILLARTFHATVTALHVLPRHLHLGAIGFADQADGDDRETAHARLAAHVSARVGDGGLEVHARIEVGEPAIKIRELARREQIDLIVMGTRGNSKLETVLFGSVAEKVVHHTGCPVVVVPPVAERA
jgi:nucleotide-binding universal stress UspA family protein